MTEIEKHISIKCTNAQRKRLMDVLFKMGVGEGHGTGDGWLLLSCTTGSTWMYRSHYPWPSEISRKVNVKYD